MANEIEVFEKNAGSFLKSIESSLKNYAVRKYDQSAFLKSAMVAIMGNDILMKATATDAGKQSLYHALRFAAATGLDLNPQQGKAVIIAYKNKDGNVIANYQVMKNGMVELALETGQVEFITADYVKQNDDFKLKKSVSGDDYEYSPALANRGDIIGFFAAMKLKNGGTHVKWMTSEEVQEVRDKYSQNYNFNKTSAENPWNKSFQSMGVKTVMKALIRSVSISPELDKYIGTDECFEPEYSVIPVTSEDVSKKLDKKPEKVQPVESGSLL
jgi:phage RecT family recombinase